MFNLQVDTAQDRLVIGSLGPNLQLPSSVKATVASSTDSFGPLTDASKPTPIISDNDLRCLLFCKGKDCSLDCCTAAREHRLATLHLAEVDPLDVDLSASPLPLDVVCEDDRSFPLLVPVVAQTLDVPTP